VTPCRCVCDTVNGQWTEQNESCHILIIYSLLYCDELRSDRSVGHHAHLINRLCMLQWCGNLRNWKGIGASWINSCACRLSTGTCHFKYVCLGKSYEGKWILRNDQKKCFIRRDLFYCLVLGSSDVTIWISQKIIKFYFIHVSGFSEEKVIEIGKKIKFYFYFSLPPKDHYSQWEWCKFQLGSIYHGLAPFVLLVALHKLLCGARCYKTIQMTISKF
jgi:hypothetical protein